MLMLKPDHSQELEPEQDAPEQIPSSEDLMMLVFSGPMCFACLEEGEVEERSDGRD